MPQACKQCGTIGGTIAGALCPACLMRLATMPESRVPDFEIETLLGSGTGTTYLARAADGSLLTVKRLTGSGDAALGSLADALHAVDHPHLARTLAIDDDMEGTVSLIRAYVPGIAFERWLAGASSAARAEARQALADALARLHSAGLAHGHVTATNIVIGPGSRAKLLDAGARAAMCSARGETPDLDAMRMDDVAQLDVLFRTGT